MGNEEAPGNLGRASARAEMLKAWSGTSDVNRSLQAPYDCGWLRGSCPYLPPSSTSVLSPTHPYTSHLTMAVHGSDVLLILVCFMVM